jgi:hypothetical protein
MLSFYAIIHITVISIIAQTITGIVADKGVDIYDEKEKRHSKKI